MSLGDKVRPVFRKVYIQYKTREVGESNPMSEKDDSVSK